MKEKLSTYRKALKARRMINQFNADWDDVSAEFGNCTVYLQRIVKKTYTREGDYRNLLKKAQKNKQAKVTSTADVNEVVVAETGYLMDLGFNNVLGSGLPVYVPNFCINELEKLSKSYAEANDLLNIYWGLNGLETVDIRWKEQLHVVPSYSVKNRSWGIVAVCVFLINSGYKVRLYTNSYEVENLAALQDCGIDVINSRKK